MFIDFVFPEDNEEELLEVAEKLGTKELCFVYIELPEDLMSRLSGFKSRHKTKLYFGNLLQSMGKKKKKISTDFVLAESNDPGETRKLLEQKKADIIYGMEFHSRKDYMHQLDSGLNHVLAKIAKENNVSFGFSLFRYNSLGRPQKVKVLARLLQNIRLYNKYKLRLKLFSGTGDAFGLAAETEIKAMLNVLKYK